MGLMTTIPLQGRKGFSTELLYRSKKLTYLLTLKTRENTDCSPPLWRE